MLIKKIPNKNRGENWRTISNITRRFIIPDIFGMIYLLFYKNRIYTTLLNLIWHEFNRKGKGWIKPNQLLSLK